MPPRLPAPQDYAQLKAQRRQLRKGTHSCWECKRRKMKCIFEPGAKAVACNGCRRRGSRCISQEFLEDSGIDVEMAADLPGNDSALVRDTSSAARSVPDTPHSPTVSLSLEPRTVQVSDKPDTLSRFLHGSLPSHEDTTRIWNAIPQRPALAHEIMTMPYTCLSQNERTEYGNILEIPNPDTHPVLIARHMLLLASLLQHLDPRVHADIRGLAEAPRNMSERLANLAINHVTTKDELVGSIEGLDCIMIESVFQANLGNLRRSWLACRRAVSVSQLMGLGRLNSRTHYEVLETGTRYNTSHIWSRIIFMDRFLCLLLGLPQASPEKTTDLYSDANLGAEGLLPMERLERIHCLVASRVLERNEGAMSADSPAVTQRLDLELQRAARSVPSKWWLIPKLGSTGMDRQANVWATGQLFAQVLHYNLLIQLHLPYMLRSANVNRRHAYSRITCVTASREVLTRFVTLRSFNGIASSCRIVDFIALMAAITLLLAHLDSRDLGPEDVLGHQSHSDRAMIEQVQENFQEINNLNSDALSAHSVDLLQKLLAIEAESNTHGSSQSARRVSVHEENDSSQMVGLNDEGAVSVHIPYFGVIHITRDGLRSVHPRPQQSTLGTDSHSTQSHAVGSRIFSEKMLSTTHGNCQTQPPNFDPIHGSLNAQSIEMANINNIHVNTATQGQPNVSSTRTRSSSTEHSTAPFVLQQQQHMDSLADFLHPGEPPGLAATMEDWAFQGIDLNLFDSLMRTQQGAAPQSSVL